MYSVFLLLFFTTNVSTQHQRFVVPKCDDPNEIFTRDALGAICDIRCNTYKEKALQVCTDYFHQRCICRSGYIREYVNGGCILPRECEKSYDRRSNTRTPKDTKDDCVVDFNEILDGFLTIFDRAIIGLSLDPMPVTDLSIILPGLPSIFSGTMDLSNITLNNLATMKRLKESFLCFPERNKLVLEMNVGWDELIFDAAYTLTFLFERRGIFHGTARGIEILLVCVVNPENGEIDLWNIQVANPGEYDIKLNSSLPELVEFLIVRAIIKLIKNFLSILSFQSEIADKKK